MRRICRNILFCFVALALFALLAKGQDAPQSLGDVARKTRDQKQQQNKDAQDKAKPPAKKPRVITDDEVVHSVADPPPGAADEPSSAASPLSSNRRHPRPPSLPCRALLAVIN